jgi:hypothetical protein
MQASMVSAKNERQICAFRGDLFAEQAISRNRGVAAGAGLPAKDPPRRSRLAGEIRE